MGDKKLSQLFPGFTFTICIGEYAGFHFRKAENVLGVCLGWIAFTCYMFDHETAMTALIERYKNGK